MIRPWDPFRFSSVGVTLPNRMVLAAMTNKQSNEDGSISEAEVEWLQRRAQGGFGLITTAASHVTADGRGWRGAFGVHSDAMIRGLRSMASTIDRWMSCSMVQLFHGGIRAPQSLTGQPPVSASDWVDDDGVMAQGLSEEEVESLRDAFIAAAVRCSNAGCSGVELHAAHGYLLAQFLGTRSNRRKDAWGGDLPRRSHLLMSIIEGIRDACGHGFLISVRISPTTPSIGITLDDSLDLVDLLSSTSMNLLHISCWDVRKDVGDGDSRSLTRRFRDHLDIRIPLLSTGSIWTEEDASWTMREGADLVGIARAAIAHPDWAKECQPGFAPQRPPFTAEHLKAASLAPEFIQYMRNWKGFVA